MVPENSKPNQCAPFTVKVKGPLMDKGGLIEEKEVGNNLPKMIASSNNLKGKVSEMLSLREYKMFIRR